MFALRDNYGDVTEFSGNKFTQDVGAMLFWLYELEYGLENKTISVGDIDKLLPTAMNMFYTAKTINNILKLIDFTEADIQAELDRVNELSGGRHNQPKQED